MLKRFFSNRVHEKLNYFTEQIRHNKALTCLLEEKIHTEFPALSKYSAGKKNSFGILRFTQFGQIYPGSDLNPDPLIHSKCELSVQVSKLKPFLFNQKTFSYSEPAEPVPKEDREKVWKKFKVLASDYLEMRNTLNGKSEEVLTISTNVFPSFGQNKKWTLDTLIRLIQTCQDVSDYQYYENEVLHPTTNNDEEEVEFPKEWLRPDVPRKRMEEKERIKMENHERFLQFKKELKEKREKIMKQTEVAQS